MLKVANFSEMFTLVIWFVFVSYGTTIESQTSPDLRSKEVTWFRKIIQDANISQRQRCF